MGRFVMAAKHHSNVAELYETDSMDIEKAISHYEKVPSCSYIAYIACT